MVSRATPPVRPWLALLTKPAMASHFLGKFHPESLVYSEAEQTQDTPIHTLMYCLLAFGGYVQAHTRPADINVHAINMSRWLNLPFLVHSVNESSTKTTSQRTKLLYAHKPPCRMFARAFHVSVLSATNKIWIAQMNHVLESVSPLSPFWTRVLCKGTSPHFPTTYQFQDSKSTSTRHKF